LCNGNNASLAAALVTAWLAMDSTNPPRGGKKLEVHSSHQED